jgi:hypothetical protein
VIAAAALLTVPTAANRLRAALGELRRAARP